MKKIAVGCIIALLTMSLSFDGYALTSPSVISPEALEKSLLGDLKPLAGEFIAAEEKHGVGAIWLASIAALESGWGGSKLAQSKNNLFGWSGKDGYMSFESKAECIDFVARQIAKNYLDPDGAYFNGTDIEGVAMRYCPAPEWAEVVRGVHDGILRRARHEASG